MRLVLIAFTVVALSVQAVVSSPNYKRAASNNNISIGATTTDNLNDTVIAQFFAVLGNINVAFYNCSLTQFDNTAFENANYDPGVRRRFVEIFTHEKDHLSSLNNILGDKFPKACNYTFPPLPDVRTFVLISRVLEEIATSAYVGAMRFLKSPEFVSLAASILAIEANQAAWLASSASNNVPWGGSFKNVLSMNQSWNLGSNFIVPGSCSTNLGLTEFPALNISGTFPGNQSVIPGNTAKILQAPKAATHIVFLGGLIGLTASSITADSSRDLTTRGLPPSGLHPSGLTPPPIFVPIINSAITLPQNLSGQVIAIATAGVTANDSASLDSITVAKPVIFWFERFANDTPTN